MLIQKSPLIKAHRLLTASLRVWVVEAVAMEEEGRIRVRRDRLVEITDARGIDELGPHERGDAS